MSVSRKLLLAVGLVGLCTLTLAQAAPFSPPVIPDADDSLFTQIQKKGPPVGSPPAGYYNRKGPAPIARSPLGPSIKGSPVKGQVNQGKGTINRCIPVRNDCSRSCAGQGSKTT